MSFEADFARLLDSVEPDVRSGRPRAVLVRLGKGSSSGPVNDALAAWAGDDWATWHGRADGGGGTLAERLAPEESRQSVAWETPPRVDTVLLTARGGINVCSVSREDSALDPDILSGMMEAVRNFIADSLRMQVGAAGTASGSERFEMHGYTILNAATGSATLSVILEGAAGPSAEADVHRIAAGIDERFGELLRGWRGATADVAGIRDAIERSFFSSKRYEGEWDVSALPLLHAKAQDGFLELARAASRERPLAVVVEGLDGADEPSLSLLAHLARNAGGYKLLLVASYRSAVEPPEHFKAVLSEALSPAAIEHPGHASVESILGSCDAARRGDALSLLRGWAVVSTMDHEAIGELCAIGAERAEGAFEALRRAGFSVSAGEAIDPYLAEMAVAGLPEQERQVMCRRGAEVLRRRRPGDVVRIAELLADAASADPALAEEAAGFCEAAANRLTGALSFQKAEAMWLAAAGLHAEGDRRLGALWNAMELEFHLNDYERLRANAGRLLSAAAEAGSMRHSWRAHWMLGRVAAAGLAPDRGLAAFSEAEGILAATNDHAGMAVVLNSKGSAKNQLGDLDEALELFGRAASMATRAGDQALTAKILVNTGAVLRKKGDYDGAQKAMNDGLALARECGSTWDVPAILWHLSLLAYDKGDYGGSEEAAAKAFEEAKALSDWKNMVRALTTRAAALDKLGRPEDVERITLEALAISDRTGAGDRLAIVYNIFEVKHGQQLDWLKRTIEASKRQNVAHGTYARIGSEILRPLLAEVALMNELVDGSGDPGTRRKLAAELESLLAKLRQEGA